MIQEGDDGRYIGAGRERQGRKEQLATNGTPVDAKSVTEILGGKIRKLGIKFKFGQLILRKIIKIVATRCHILRLKCNKFDFGWGSVPDPAGAAYSAPPDSLAGFKPFKGFYF